jgi:hypothetical protein
VLKVRDEPGWADLGHMAGSPLDQIGPGVGKVVQRERRLMRVV